MKKSTVAILITLLMTTGCDALAATDEDEFIEIAEGEENNGEGEFIPEDACVEQGCSYYVIEEEQGSVCDILWSYEIAGVIDVGGMALGADGAIYAGSTEGIIYALNPDGSEKWTIMPRLDDSFFTYKINQLPADFEGNTEQLPDSIIVEVAEDTPDSFGHSSPTITADGSTVYFAGRISGVVYAIDTASGSIVWAFDVKEIPETRDDPIHYGGGFVSSPAIGADGTLYIGSGDWWGDQWYEALELGFDANQVINRRFSDKRLYAINPDGTLKWIFSVEETDTGRTSLFASPAIGPDGLIYIGSFNGIFYALRDDGEAASEVWRYEATGANPQGEIFHLEFWGSAAIGADGAIYVGSNDTYVYAFNPDGSIRWRVRTGSEVYQSPVIGGEGIIYIGSEDRHMYAINPDGSVRWLSRTGLDDELPFTAAVTQDETIIYGLSASDRLISLDGETGELNWQCVLSEDRTENGTANNPAIGADGVIYIFGGNDIHAINGDSPLSTSSAWPRVQGDARNSGRSSP